MENDLLLKMTNARMNVEGAERERANMTIFFRMSRNKEDLVSAIDDIINNKDGNEDEKTKEKKPRTGARIRRVGQFPEESSGSSSSSSSSSSSGGSSSSSEEDSLSSQEEGSPRPSTSKGVGKAKRRASKKKKKAKKSKAMDKKRKELTLMKEKLEVMERMMEMQEKMKKSQGEAKKRDKQPDTQEILMIKIDEEERFEDDEVLEPKKKPENLP